jgi:hypothetical protein
MSKQLKAAVVSFALVLVPALYAHADCRHRTELIATDEGAAIGAAGHAEARQQGIREQFKVQVEADVADGTVFNAFADGNFAGTLTTSLGVAELELDSENFSLPNELRPVCNLSVVEVTDAGGVLILSGNF